LLQYLLFALPIWEARFFEGTGEEKGTREVKMKIYLIALCVLFGVGIQSESFEKRALSVPHRIPASSLDAKLPDTPFDAWLTDTVGRMRRRFGRWNRTGPAGMRRGDRALT
jgi:hypothetical protein